MYKVIQTPVIKLARCIRHASWLQNADAIWDALRPIYLRLLDPRQRGVEIELGNRPIRLPPEVLSTHPDWSSYEKLALIRLGAWLDCHPDKPTLFDIGSSFGVISSFALQIHPTAQAIAFDPDGISLRAMEAVVPIAAHPRLQRIQCYLGRTHLSEESLPEAIRTTSCKIPVISPRSAISRSRYGTLTQPDNAPQHQLDELLSGIDIPGSLLIKCDVEGAEVLVLQGARQTLLRKRPELLLSVHAELLHQFGHSKDDVSTLLQQLNYNWECFARDHEEHWWARPIE